MRKATAAVFACVFIVGCAPSVEEGIADYKAGKYERAYQTLVNRSDKPLAQIYLSKMLFSGLGVPKNVEKGFGYLKSAADSGDPTALLELADRYRWGYGVPEDRSEAVSLYLKAAEKGQHSAYAGVGELTNDKARAFQYYLKAAGTARGELALARAYEMGSGVPRSPKQSFDHLQALTRLTGEEAKNYNLDYLTYVQAEYYYYGFGTQKDNGAALRLLESIKDKKSDAKALYAWMLFHGEGVQAAPSEAVKIWLALMEIHQKNREASPYLSIYAFYGLAIAFTDGVGTGANPDKAALFKAGGGVVSSPENPARWLNIKYNALGYLDKECRPSALVSGIDDEYGRYISIYSEAQIAVKKCSQRSK